LIHYGTERADMTDAQERADASEPADASERADALTEDEARREISDVRTRWRTRQVLDAAVRLMNGNGFHAVSMQALAREADISVGLIYKYFGGKEDVVVAVVLDLVGEIQSAIEARMAAAGADPVERLAAGFAAYCTVMDSHRNASLLTYRQSGVLGSQARNRIKMGELSNLSTLRKAAAQAAEAGLLAAGVDVDLLVFDLMLLAQGWALKSWHFPASYDVARYIAAQTASVLRSALADDAREPYRRLLETAA
jgi:AcrR family transcriptional regulator